MTRWALLASTVNHRLDERVRDRIIAETGGNPLAILELRRMGPAELAGGYGMPTAATVSAHIEDGYVRRINALPERTRQLVLLAAADPTGDATLLWRAALTLGIGRDAAAAADVDRLLEIGGRVRFRHPLVRSAAYAAALPEHRCAAHLALAEATDVRTDPERRVWHLAAAATGPDEGIASALERIAHSVQGRAGLAAAAAFMHRAVELSADVGLRADRALAAAQAHLNAGAYDAARGLLAEAAALAVDDLQRARVEQLDGQIEAAANPGREAPGRLLHAARRLEPLDAQLARDTYLQAWWAAVLAGEHATPGGGLVEISRAVRAAPSPAHPRVCDLLLVGLATVITHGRQAAAPYLRPAIDLFLKDQVSDDEWLQWGRSATTAALALWDMDSWTELSSRQIDRTRASGALASLVLSLNLHAFGTTNRGDLEAAAALVAEQNAVREATGTRMASYGARLLAAYQGHPFDQSPQIDAARRRTRSEWRRVRHRGCESCDRGAEQWSRAVLTRDRRRPKGGVHDRLHGAVRTVRADRSRSESREHGPCEGCRATTLGPHRRGIGLGRRHRGARAGLDERRRRGRPVLHRLDHVPFPNPAAARCCPEPALVR